jgi:hypothetical protein
MFNDSCAGRNPTRVVVPIEEDEEQQQSYQNDMLIL